MRKLILLAVLLTLTGCVKKRYYEPRCTWGALDKVEIAQMRCDQNICSNEWAKAVLLEDLSCHNKFVYKINSDAFGENFHILGLDSSHDKTDYGVGYFEPRGDLIVYDEEDQQLKEFRIILEGYGPAESADFYLLSLNYEKAIHLHITPHPIVLERDGYRVTFDRLDHLGHDFIVHGIGYEPGELVSIYTNNEGAIKTFNVVADSKGEIVTILESWVPGSGGGNSKVEISASQGMVELTLPWGKNYWSSKEEFVKDRVQADRDERLRTKGY